MIAAGGSLETGIDASIFARAAELLARPLSPTALEKEALQTTDATNQPPVDGPSTKAFVQESVATAPVKEVKTSEATGGAALASAQCIGDVVAGLNSFQREMKEKLRSPSARKQGPPKIRRHDPKVLTEFERREKMSEIEALEKQLRKTKGQAGSSSSQPTLASGASKAPSRPRSRAGSNASSQCPSAPSSARGTTAKETPLKDASREQDGHGSCNQEVPAGDVENKWKKQAEERVKARMLEEASARKEQRRRAEEEKQTRHQESEVRARELEAAARDRVQARLRDERKKEQQQKAEELREIKEREERAQRQEEHRLKALKRAAERHQAEERRALEEAMVEAEHKMKQEEESKAKAVELQERTRQRIQQREQEQLERRAAEEAQQRALAAEQARLAEEKLRQQQMSLERAKARAANFRQRLQTEEHERAKLEQEREEFERVNAEQALKERQNKRQWRLQGHRSESPVRGAAQEAAAPPDAESTRTKGPPQQRKMPAAKLREHPREGVDAEHTALPPKASVMPPKPPQRRGAAKAPQPARNVQPAEFEIVEPLWRPDADEDSAAGHNCQSNGAVCCTVDFFGVGGVLDDDEIDHVSARRQVDAVLEQPASGAGRKLPMLDTRLPTSKLRRVGSSPHNRARSEPPPRPAPAGCSRPNTASSTNSDRYLESQAETFEHNPGLDYPEDRFDLQMLMTASEDINPPQAPSPQPARQKPAWKQKAIPLQSNDYYLDLIKGSRAKPGVSQQAKPPSGGPSAWSEGPRGYASQLQRAADVQAQQNMEADRRMGRGFAVLQKVQQRALQATPSRSVSAESGLEY
mmetsp:Transcript_266/g.898  ORF Transcript_266/g.898 Transcript_266/m.898 type:complete len:815 (-) Transcript_266:117-2561(-)